MLNFLWDKRTLLAIVLLELFIIVSFLFIDTGVDVKKYENRIESLQFKIESLETKNDSLQMNIEGFYEIVQEYEEDIHNLNTDLRKIREQKDVKINTIDTFNHSELQRFFAERYKDSTAN